jgi:hypothetical protein
VTTTNAYSSHATNWLALAVAVGLVLPMAALSQPDLGDLPSGSALGGLAVVLVIAVVGLLTATSLRVTIGSAGVVARLGVLGVPVFRYGVDQIAAARAVTISRWATPGVFWTHRDGLRLALHGGSAVRLELRGGRRVTIGVPNAHAALEALAHAGVEGPGVG